MMANDVAWVVFWMLFFRKVGTLRGWDTHQVLLLFAILTHVQRRRASACSRTPAASASWSPAASSTRPSRCRRTRSPTCSRGGSTPRCWATSPSGRCCSCVAGDPTPERAAGVRVRRALRLGRAGRVPGGARLADALRRRPRRAGRPRLPGHPDLRVLPARRLRRRDQAVPLHGRAGGVRDAACRRASSRASAGRSPRPLARGRRVRRARRGDVPASACAATARARCGRGREAFAGPLAVFRNCQSTR